MKTRLANRNGNQRALTLIEVLVILVIIGVVGILFITALAKAKARSNHFRCTSNLGLVWMAFRVWEEDNHNVYPPAIYTNAAGGPLYVDSANIFRYFSAMSNEINNPKVMVCPQDLNRHSATNFGPDFDSRKTSYFINLDAKNDSNRLKWLVGDDGLTNALPNVQGLITVTSNAPVVWQKPRHDGHGNIALADGSVQQYSNLELKSLAETNNWGTNRLLMPLP